MIPDHSVNFAPAAAHRWPVSVIIPVYNGARHLAEAIQSVLDQSCPPSQVIVVDDGSTDCTPDVIAQFQPRIHSIRQANGGSAAARNCGVQHAAAEWLAFLDGDDLWVPDKLSLQLAAAAAQPDREAVLGRVENFISPELDAVEQAKLAYSAAVTGSFHAGTLLIRRTAFHRVGWFDTRWRQSEFIEWWDRALAAQLRFTVLPELLLRRRLHAHNSTRQQPDRVEYAAMLRAVLARRRRSGSSP